MKLVKYKYLSVILKTTIKKIRKKVKQKDKRKRKQNIRTRRRNKKIKTSINKLKCISCQKCFTKIQKMKNIQSKIKPIKIGKQSRTTHCFGCRVWAEF